MKNTKDNGDLCVLAALGADHVILVHRVYAQACLDPSTEDGFSSGAFDKIIDALHEKGKTAIVVSCQLPYDAARFPEADAILLTYWGSTMRELPAEGSSWSANLPAGLLSCFGLGEAKGVLPVNIPALDEAYQPTDEILWKRGYSAADMFPTADELIAGLPELSDRTLGVCDELETQYGAEVPDAA